MRKLLLPLLIVGLCAGAVAPATKSADVFNDGVAVALKGGGLSLVENRPYTRYFVVTNVSKTTIRNGTSFVSPRSVLGPKAPAGCTQDNHVDQVYHGGFVCTIKRLAPGKSLSFKVTMLVSSSDYPNGHTPFKPYTRKVQVWMLASDSHRHYSRQMRVLTILKAEE